MSQKHISLLILQIIFHSLLLLTTVYTKDIMNDLDIKTDQIKLYEDYDLLSYIITDKDIGTIEYDSEYEELSSSLRLVAPKKFKGILSNGKSSGDVKVLVDTEGNNYFIFPRYYYKGNDLKILMYKDKSFDKPCFEYSLKMKTSAWLYPYRDDFSKDHSTKFSKITDSLAAISYDHVSNDGYHYGCVAVIEPNKTLSNKCMTLGQANKNIRFSCINSRTLGGVTCFTGSIKKEKMPISYFNYNINSGKFNMIGNIEIGEVQSDFYIYKLTDKILLLIYNNNNNLIVELLGTSKGKVTGNNKKITLDDINSNFYYHRISNKYFLIMGENNKKNQIYIYYVQYKQLEIYKEILFKENIVSNSLNFFYSDNSLLMLTFKDLDKEMVTYEEYIFLQCANVNLLATAGLKLNINLNLISKNDDENIYFRIENDYDNEMLRFISYGESIQANNQTYYKNYEAIFTRQGKVNLTYSIIDTNYKLINYPIETCHLFFTVDKGKVLKEDYYYSINEIKNCVVYLNYDTDFQKCGLIENKFFQTATDEDTSYNIYIDNYCSASFLNYYQMECISEKKVESLESNILDGVDLSYEDFNRKVPAIAERPELSGSVKVQKLTMFVHPKDICPNHPRTIFFRDDPKLVYSRFPSDDGLGGHLESINIYDKKFIVLFKGYQNIPACLTGPFAFNNIVRTTLYDDTNIIWKLLNGKELYLRIKELNKYQRYNHFPNYNSITRKDTLYDNFKSIQKRFPKDFDYMPETYILPRDKQIFDKLFKDYKIAPDNLWLLKPVAMSRGRNIHLMENPKDVPKNTLITKYLYNPHLINNRKYDLRIYLLVTGYTPIKIYMFHEGLTRFASEEYNLNIKNIGNLFIHLTNYAINKNNTNYEKNDDMSLEKGNKWSLSTLKKHYASEGIDYEPIWEKIKDILIKTILSVADKGINVVRKFKNVHSNSLYEVYGVDILIDNNFKPWLIEVNLNPSLNTDSLIDLKVKSKLATDIFNIIGVIPYTHEEDFKPYDEDIEYENSVEEAIQESLCEFSRPNGGFERIFPKARNIDYYKEFISNPGPENLGLWKIVKEKGL